MVQIYVRPNKPFKPIAREDARSGLTAALDFMRANIAVLLMAFAAAGCGSLLRASTAEVVSLAYVGSVYVGSPETNGNVTHIPLAFSGGQWQQNSGRVLKEVRVRHFASEIHFSVVTCVATNSPPAMPEIVLEALRPGTYQLFYQNPDATSIRLGIIEIQHAVAADRPKTGAG